MIAIIDYDAGNIKSVEKAFSYLGENVVLTRDRDIILNASKAVLPGVGAFGDAMARLRGFGLEKVIHQLVERRIPLLGICLGLQLLFERSEESAGVKGLGILDGEIVRIPSKEGVKVPHIGWNSLSYPNRGRLFDGIEEDAYVYFVHSYYLEARDKSTITAETDYGVCIQASVEKDNIFACQFHPEKSSEIGLTILRNFINIGKEE